VNDISIVKVRGRPYSVNPINNSLTLRGKNIKIIREIEGIESLIDLVSLDLAGNNITHI